MVNFQVEHICLDPYDTDISNYLETHRMAKCNENVAMLNMDLQ